MRDNRLLCMLTMALLATWSPGTWCCCRAGAAESVPAKAQHSSCCSRHESPAAMPSGGAHKGHDCCSPIPGDAPSCGCLHGAADAALPAAATAPVTNGTRGPDHDLIAWLPPVLGSVTAPGRPALTCRGSPRCPPDRSLLTLHCMLTV